MRKLIPFLAVALIAGCGKKIKVDANPKLPDWFLAAPTGCGVGEAPNMGSVQLAMNAAETTARGELQRSITSTVSSRITSAAQQGQVGSEGFLETKTESINKVLSSGVLAGATIQKQELKGDRMYVMVCMDASNMASALEGLDDLNSAQKKMLDEMMTDMNDTMEQELKDYGLR